MTPGTMAAEKQIANISESGLSQSDEEGQEITWTEAEEKALLRRYGLCQVPSALCLRKGVCLLTPNTRVDLLVMPLLILGFFALQLDRGNMCVFFPLLFCSLSDPY
jgi:hypothetical protein